MINPTGVNKSLLSPPNNPPDNPPIDQDTDVVGAVPPLALAVGLGGTGVEVVAMDQVVMIFWEKTQIRAA